MNANVHTIDRPRQAPTVRTVWLLFAAIFITVYFASLFSPPLLDDVDAAHAQAAQHMAESGDLITSKINGIRYIEKPPLPYWLVAGMYKIFGAEHLCHAPAQRAGHAGTDLAGMAVGAAGVGRSRGLLCRAGRAHFSGLLSVYALHYSRGDPGVFPAAGALRADCEPGRRPACAHLLVCMRAWRWRC